MRVSTTIDWRWSLLLMVLIPSLLIPCRHLSGILTSFAAKYCMGFFVLQGSTLCKRQKCAWKCEFMYHQLCYFYVQVSMIVTWSTILYNCNYVCFICWKLFNVSSMLHILQHTSSSGLLTVTDLFSKRNGLVLQIAQYT